ncbi:type VI secretion system-associated protein TagF [Catenovulum sp. SM1970]|uniref:type VI secretion system-associated protein TagF n=1 Tax=Marinifaba aquimaris TaxID=2741323 RepID=UPI001574A269|nr:type VI secretion system-associated protein TagF [Marinifaba aquimaris]NTS77905.1 type VI secretion system-associated protein TagF [Marinifaba aquimaris]
MLNFFSRKKAVEPVIQKVHEFGYLGKTALRPDFVKLNVSSRELINLDNWLQEGFAYVHRQGLSHNADKDSTPCLYFLSGGNEDSNVMGLMQPSVDSSGRHYPFVSFVHSGADLYKKHPSCMFLAHVDAIQQLLMSTDKVYSSRSIEEMEFYSEELSHVAGMLKNPVDLTQVLDRFRHIAMADFWHATGLSDIENRAVFIRESSLSMQSMANRGCLRTHFGLRFPMPVFSPENAYVGAFWLHLVTMMVADHNWQPWFFYSLGSAQHKPSMTIFVRPVPASCFDSVWNLSRQSQNVIDLVHTTASSKPSQSDYELAGAENVSLYDALRRWCKGV